MFAAHTSRVLEYLNIRKFIGFDSKKTKLSNCTLLLAIAKINDMK